MGILDFFNMPEINQGLEEYRATPGAVLLDVRTQQEYREGHIPESKNIPLHTLQGADGFAENLDTPLFVYCQSGVRSGQGVAVLKRMGYRKVKNIGGISAYRGKVVK